MNNREKIIMKNKRIWSRMQTRRWMQEEAMRWIQQENE